MGLSHFEPNRAAAQNQQVIRAAGQVEQGRVGEMGGDGQPGDRRLRRAAAGGDYDAPGGDSPRGAPRYDLQRIPAGKPRRAQHHVGAERAVTFGRIRWRDRRDDALHMGLHGRPIDHRLGKADAQACGVPARLGSVRGGEQRLARHASRIEAIAAHAVPLDQGGAQAELRGGIGHGQPRGPGADHRDVIVRHGCPAAATPAT